ncbi:40s ribosomal protein s29 [Plasmopara halstedii]|uniref:40s ribosomal protein s29 n=1 Tax=Plasmopara halstedii TaxID=4781 RepID=A0A0P1B5K1_PLAHL|nr:40s ribosomal protein s29 [Plasmopara halstedii]CEG49284.1 40s ribosomal protein s29 [Plasmopara halstedii]|eukprot:XP_024585653.1 40s ribosomal protein s29 [Plasmopara halstedii]
MLFKKSAIMANLAYSHPRNYGKDSRHCRVCKTTRGLIRKYNLNMCRRCFRERATDIGFVKYRGKQTAGEVHPLFSGHVENRNGVPYAVPN